MKTNAPPLVTTSSTATRSMRPVTTKSKLKGVVVTSRKRAKPEGEGSSNLPHTLSATVKKGSNLETKTEENVEPDAKRRKLV